MTEYTQREPGLESPNMDDSELTLQPAPQPQWNPTAFVDLVATKWQLQPDDRKELHEFAMVGVRLVVCKPNKLPDDDPDWPQCTKGHFCNTDLHLCMPAKHKETTCCTRGAGQQYKEALC